MGALKAAAIRMGGLREGRKSIIFVSEGFTESLPPQLQRSGRGDARRRQSQPQQRAARRRRARQTAARKTDMLTECGDVFQTVNRRTRRSMRSIPVASRRSSTASTKALACSRTARVSRRHSTRCTRSSNNTDGRAIVNRNDLAVGMKQIMRDSSGYYLLGYTSTRAPTDGGSTKSR